MGEPHLDPDVIDPLSDLLMRVNILAEEIEAIEQIQRTDDENQLLITYRDVTSLITGLLVAEQMVSIRESQ